MPKLVDSWWYIVGGTVKFLFDNWGQFVNNLRTQDGKTSVQLSPSYVYDYMDIKNKDVKVVLLPLFIPIFTQWLSTCKSAVLDLLNIVYTHNPQYLLIEPLKKI